MTLLKEVNAKNINISLLSLEARINELANSASGDVNLDNVNSQLASLSARVENLEQGSDVGSLIADIEQLDRQVTMLTSSVSEVNTKINTEIDDREAADTALQNNIDNKVDKVSGKGLSTNDFTDADKAKLDSLHNTVVDSALSSTSTNPVQNKVIDAALDNKVDKVSGKGLSSNDFTTTEKNKLAGIADGANKTTVDTTLSSTSTKPVQNKVINTALEGKQDKLVTKTYTLPTLTSAGTRYIKLATCKWNDVFNIKAYLYGNNLEDTVSINVLGGNATYANANGWFTTYDGHTNTVLIKRAPNYNSNFEVWLKIYQSTTCTVKLTVEKTYESRLNTNTTLNVTTTAPSTSYSIPLLDGGVHSGTFNGQDFYPLWSGTSSTGAQQITLGDNITNFKFILVAGIFYTSTNEQKQTLLIPVSEAMWNLTNTAWMMCGSTGETDRRLRFGFSSPSVLSKYESVGTSSHLPVITNVWGIL